jgi:hypothetical protein
MKKMKRSQIWVETVIYTLIGLALVGLVLAVATPKINERKDRILVEQTLSSLNTLDEKINEVLSAGPGNSRIISELSIKKGKLLINSSGNSINFVLDELSKPYSEPGIIIKRGNVEFVSVQGKKQSSVYFALSYTGIVNLTYNGKKDIKEFPAVGVPYKFSIENVDGNRIDVKETS